LALAVLRIYRKVLQNGSARRNKGGNSSSASSPLFTGSYFSLADLQRAHQDSASRSNSSETPNLPKIYAFLALLFDPDCNDHLARLSEMSALDRETTQILMHNMAINMANQQISEHKMLALDQCQDVLKQPISDRTVCVAFLWRRADKRARSLMCMRTATASSSTIVNRSHLHRRVCCAWYPTLPPHAWRAGIQAPRPP
jgi:hypothetical protein